MGLPDRTIEVYLMKRKEVRPRRRRALIERLEVAAVAGGNRRRRQLRISYRSAANSYVYDPGGSAWTFSSTSGIVNSPSSLDAPAAPDGKQVAFLQTNRSASQYNGCRWHDLPIHLATIQRDTTA